MKKTLLALMTIICLLNSSLASTTKVTVNGVGIKSTNASETMNIESKIPEVSGWEVKTENTTVTEDGLVTIPDADVEIEGIILDENKYDLTVDFPDFTESSKKISGSKVTVNAARDDMMCKFKSWTATGISLTSEQSRQTVITFTMPANAVSLVANYDQLYEIKYNANGGKNTPNKQMKVENEDLELTSSIPTRQGHTFLGWSTDRASNSAEYEAGDIFELD